MSVEGEDNWQTQSHLLAFSQEIASSKNIKDWQMLEEQVLKLGEAHEKLLGEDEIWEELKGHIPEKDLRVRFDSVAGKIIPKKLSGSDTLAK
jgi:hypothetical protein